MSNIQRSGTRKGGPAPARQKKTYDIVSQGIKEIYPLEKNTVKPEIDIVFIPGLGAHPEDSWKSTKSDFNWMTSEEGLVRDFPKSRILLYLYESAWIGPLKVKQYMTNVAMTLLVALESKRKDCPRRPVVFIGHSMGGLVAAKAITLADTRRDKFPTIFEAIAASISFGSPFKGTPNATVAGRFAQLAEKFDQASASKLLDFMTPGDESLRELRYDFMRLVAKLDPKIEVLCFFEEQPTDFAEMAGLPHTSLVSKLVPTKFSKFVERDSATLEGGDEQGLASNHRNLVKCEGPRDEKWNQLVRDPMKKLIQKAPLITKNRFNSTRGIDRAMVSGIMEALDGAQVSRKRRTLVSTFGLSSWITKEKEYDQWLCKAPSEGEQHRVADCIWIRGPEGRGKTSATMAVLDEIDSLVSSHEEQNSGEAPILMAYFFCDTTADHSSAEELLKSLVRQLISQHEALAPYAKLFAKKKAKDGDTRATATAQITVENLWQSLQDMLADEFTGSRVFFVVNNIHVLPDTSESTVKLMKYINAELQHIKSSPETKRVRTRWFITSRQAYNVEEALKVDGTRLIDLEDEKYGDAVKLALRRHAKDKISALEKDKRYNKALAYFASSLIGKRAQNTQWIDITCVQLKELPDTSSDLRVRRVLETLPQDVNALLSLAWQQVFKANNDDAEKIKELLRAMVLTFEDPSEAELGILAGLSSTEEEKTELHRLVVACKPLLATKNNAKSDVTVSFMNKVVKNHLLQHAGLLLGLSEDEIRWQHGVLTLRSFQHLKQIFDNPELEKEIAEAHAAAEAAALQDDQEAEEVEEEEDETEVEEAASQVDHDEDSDSDDGYTWTGDETTETDPERQILMDKALPYTVKFFLQHAGHATREIADDLSQEEDFWKIDSVVRRRWVIELERMTGCFAGFDILSFTALHVAACVGYRQLVAALIDNGHQDEISIRDKWEKIPLHLAAYHGQDEIVEELLDKRSFVDEGIKQRESTPLSMAASRGHVKVMQKLLNRNADANAIDDDNGPVVNSAIASGNREAVELLVARGVALSIDDDSVEPPLAQAALLSDISMFDYLVQEYADRLPDREYSKAFVRAAEAGRLDVFGKLLERQHAQEYYQNALDAAADELNWDIVMILLEKCRDLECDDTFYKAATGTEPQDRVLEACWKHTKGGISQETRNRSLYDATDIEKHSTVEMLLKFHADPDATGDEFGNALTAAAYDGTMEIIDLLLDAGADINSPHGWAIQTAATEGHLKVVEKLIERGADVNAFTKSDNFSFGTALQGACGAGQKDVVALLLKKGANPNLGGGYNAPPIVAASCESEEILKLLVDAGAEINTRAGDYMAIVNAAYYLPQTSVQLLLGKGADINLEDRDGDTALIMATVDGNEEVVTLLLNNNADIMHTNKEGKNALQKALEGEQWACAKILSQRISSIFEELQNAIQAGSMEVAKVIREAQKVPVVMVEDDDEEEEEEQENEDEDDDNQEAEADCNDTEAVEEHSTNDTEDPVHIGTEHAVPSLPNGGTELYDPAGPSLSIESSPVEVPQNQTDTRAEQYTNRPIETGPAQILTHESQQIESRPTYSKPENSQPSQNSRIDYQAPPKFAQELEAPLSFQPTLYNHNARAQQQEDALPITSPPVNTNHGRPPSWVSQPETLNASVQQTGVFISPAPTPPPAQQHAPASVQDPVNRKPAPSASFENRPPPNPSLQRQSTDSADRFDRQNVLQSSFVAPQGHPTAVNPQPYRQSVSQQNFSQPPPQIPTPYSSRPSYDPHHPRPGQAPQSRPSDSQNLPPQPPNAAAPYSAYNPQGYPESKQRPPAPKPYYSADEFQAYPSQQTQNAQAPPPQGYPQQQGRPQPYQISQSQPILPQQYQQRQSQDPNAGAPQQQQFYGRPANGRPSNGSVTNLAQQPQYRRPSGNGQQQQQQQQQQSSGIYEGQGYDSPLHATHGGLERPSQNENNSSGFFSNEAMKNTLNKARFSSFGFGGKKS